MTKIETTINEQEVSKFAQHATYWWDKEGPLKTLHDINDTRLLFIQQQVSLANKKVLDVGCGGGILCEALARAGALVTGIDAEQHTIATAKAHAKEGQLAIDYHCTPVEEFKGQFDVISCMEMLEHVDHPELVLEHCKRLLKPGGMLFLSTISRTMKAYLTAVIAAEYVLGILPKQTHDYDKFIKPSELIAMARDFDLNVVAMSGLDYNPIARKASLGTDVSVNYLLALSG